MFLESSLDLANASMFLRGLGMLSIGPGLGGSEQNVSYRQWEEKVKSLQK